MRSSPCMPDTCGFAVMDIGQRSRKSLGGQGIDNVNEMLQDRFGKLQRQPQSEEKLVDSLVMC
ncbi:hypothetical protein B9L19_07995 [Geobacillus thermocatenulatus]|uniref:Uncharacterized protein n=1 Tax=Geobacillus thermocatenulatus TaxID=33938 RepID=A0AA91TG45_9BACL|nr:hypothetical protein B9L19_07995 [Geobacillus thermocatenulatus]